MKTSLQAPIRQSVIFWTIVPFVATLVLVIFVEISGRFFSTEFSDGAAGIMFLAALVPQVAAHLSFLSAIIGVILLPFGLLVDKKLVTSLVLGLAFGIFMLHKIYLG